MKEDNDYNSRGSRRVSTDSVQLQLPTSSAILERLYDSHGVRVRMVRRNKPQKIPTVRELIDQLAKKHEKLLEMEGTSTKPVEKRVSLAGGRPPDCVEPSNRLTQIGAAEGDRNSGKKTHLSEQLTEPAFPDRTPKSETSVKSKRFGSQKDDGQESLNSYRSDWSRRAESYRTDTSSLDSIRVDGRYHDGGGGGGSVKGSSSSTPTVPYSTADILYGSEVNGRSQLDDIRQNSFTELERSKDVTRQRSKDMKDLEQHQNNKRPNSKSGSRKSFSIETVAVDREKDDLSKTSLPPAKSTNHFRPNGIRNNVVKGEPAIISRSNGAVSGRDPDDLVAMGTLWSPNQQGQQPASQQQQQSSRISILQNSSSTISSNPSKVNLTSSSMTPQRKYTTNNVRPIVAQSNNISGIRNNLREKEVEPKYIDPLVGAPASFQQRLIELGALEGDTVRWERTKRLKKKKQDRDS